MIVACFSFPDVILHLTVWRLAPQIPWQGFRCPAGFCVASSKILPADPLATHQAEAGPQPLRPEDSPRPLQTSEKIRAEPVLTQHFQELRNCDPFSRVRFGRN